MVWLARAVLFGLGTIVLVSTRIGIGRYLIRTCVWAPPGNSRQWHLRNSTVQVIVLYCLGLIIEVINVAS